MNEREDRTIVEDRRQNTDHAGVIVLPPLTIVPPLLVGLILHFLWSPLRFFPEWWIGHVAGWPLVVAGVLLIAWSHRAMHHACVDPHPYEPTTAIVATGPYAVSRNPMYAAAMVVYVGIAFVVNMAWPIVLLPFGIALLHYGVIAREESYMERVLADEYLKYKARVRRWI